VCAYACAYPCACVNVHVWVCAWFAGGRSIVQPTPLSQEWSPEGQLLWRGLRVRVGMAWGYVSSKKPLNTGERLLSCVQCLASSKEPLNTGGLTRAQAWRFYRNDIGAPAALEAALPAPVCPHSARRLAAGPTYSAWGPQGLLHPCSSPPPERPAASSWPQLG